MTNLQKLRDVLQDLTYSEMMMIVAGWLADIDKSEDQINDAAFWAFVLNDWSENAELAEDEEQP